LQADANRFICRARSIGIVFSFLLNMKKSLFDSRHLMDYTFYGILSGIFYSITVWLYLYDPEFRQLWMMYVGSGFFMFVIMLYMFKLVGEQNENPGFKIVPAGHIAIISGIIVSVGICLFLCFVYKPELFSSSEFVTGAHKPAASLFHVFGPAILMNFLGGSFITLVIGYATKWNLQAHRKSISL
jgi:hypothetical protein